MHESKTINVRDHDRGENSANAGSVNENHVPDAVDNNAHASKKSQFVKSFPLDGTGIAKASVDKSKSIDSKDSLPHTKGTKSREVLTGGPVRRTGRLTSRRIGDKSTPKRAVLKTELAGIVERYGDTLVRRINKNTNKTGSTESSGKNPEVTDPLFLAKMGRIPGKGCLCRNPLNCHHDDVHLGNKSPINVTENEAHLMDVTSNISEPKQNTFDRTKTKKPRCLASFHNHLRKPKVFSGCLSSLKKRWAKNS